MTEPIKAFVPMPGGKPDEALWPAAVAEARHAATHLARKHGVQLSTAWHQSSEWATREIDGRTMHGWEFAFAIR